MIQLEEKEFKKFLIEENRKKINLNKITYPLYSSNKLEYQILIHLI
jgi:hypothetical protein